LAQVASAIFNTLTQANQFPPIKHKTFKVNYWTMH